LGLPGLISERLFALFDLDKDSHLKLGEFLAGTQRLFSSDFDENVKLIFDMLDFDGDQVASKDDIRTLLSHVPLSQVLGDLKLQIRKEGEYTKKGGGLYTLGTHF
jgi:hypothetical protein